MRFVVMTVAVLRMICPCKDIIICTTDIVTSLLLLPLLLQQYSASFLLVVLNSSKVPKGFGYSLSDVIIGKFQPLARFVSWMKEPTATGLDGFHNRLN